MWLPSLTSLNYSSPSRKQRCPTVFMAICRQSQEQCRHLQILRRLLSLVSFRLKQLPQLLQRRWLLYWASKAMHNMSCWWEVSSAIQKAQKFSTFPVTTLQVKKNIWRQEAIQLVPEQRQDAHSQGSGRLKAGGSHLSYRPCSNLQLAFTQLSSALQIYFIPT